MQPAADKVRRAVGRRDAIDLRDRNVAGIVPARAAVVRDGDAAVAGEGHALTTRGDPQVVQIRVNAVVGNAKFIAAIIRGAQQHAHAVHGVGIGRRNARVREVEGALIR